MRRIYRLGVAVGFAALAGCVVIPKTFDANINVTIRHVQDQADQLIKYVEGESEKPPEFKAPAQPEPKKTSMLQRVVDAIDPIQTAYAAELDQSSKRAQQIAMSMKTRFPDVDAAKKTGGIGEDNRGFLQLVKPDAISDPEKRNATQRVIAAENEDRKALYQEVARLNSSLNMNVATVERVFAQKRLERARAGELFQIPPAGPDFDAFKASAAGQRLGAQVVPNAWVTIK